MSVTYPRGFRASGVSAGLKASGRPDLGLLVPDGPAVASGAFTTNAFAAAPVTLSRDHLMARRARAVVVNSGHANAGTGAEGLRAARGMASAVAAALGCDSREVLVCSTGLIGAIPPLDRLTRGLSVAVENLSTEGGPAFARAILTTDKEPKMATAEAGPYRVGGCAKGAGMIGPRLAPLATMLAFVTTDAPATPEALDRIVARHVAPVFNGLVVDACQSTNDAVLMLANGAGGGPPIGPTGPTIEGLGRVVEAVCVDLARQMAAEAEGATKTLVVRVEGAPDDEAARRVGLAVASSPLVKTALFGGDPNSGRILQAAGDAGVALDPTAVDVDLDGIPVVRGGVVLETPPAAAAVMKQPEVVLRVSVGAGPGEAVVFGCDLSYEYVRINAEYTT